MPQMRRDVLRLDQRRHHVQGVEVMGEFHELGEVPQGAWTAPPLPVRRVRRPGPGLERELPQGQGRVPAARAGPQLDDAGRGGEGCFYDVPSDEDHFVLAASRACGTEQIARHGR